jgi:hypothetical protein
MPGGIDSGRIPFLLRAESFLKGVDGFTPRILYPTLDVKNQSG